MTAASVGPHVSTTGPVALSVIVCVRNGAARMHRQLDALVAQVWSEPWELLVVDNGSTDDTAAVAERYAATHAGVRLVSAPERRGLSHARNVGVAAAQGRSVAFCDDDDEVAPGWVAAMGAALADHEVVACRMEYARLSDPAALVGRTAYQSEGIEQLFGYPIVNGVSGWRRSRWQALGGNDEAMDFSGEDQDMALRAHLDAGLVPYFCGDAVYHCQRRQGVGPTFRQARRYGQAQALLYRRYGRGRPGARPPLALAVKQALRLLITVRDLRDPRTSTLWAWRAGLRVGRLSGCARFRTWFW